uniref:Capsid protein n=1 Tax=viral metagenome TaxID=1070528 RepID=A0A6H1ZR96_9ZZZZ
MANIATLDDLVTPAVVAIHDEANDQLSKELKYKKLGFQDYEPTFDEPSFSSISSVAEAVLTLEQQAYDQDDVIQGYDVSVKLKKYTKQIPISEECVHWIQKGNKEKAQEFKGVVTACTNALNLIIDQLAAKVIYLCHTTTFQTGGDGVALAAYNHPSPDPNVAVQRNIFATTEGHLPLSAGAIEKARQRMDRYYDLRGVQLMKARDLCVFVATEKEEEIKKILYSSGGPNTPNLGINPIATTYSGIKYEVVDHQPVAYKDYWSLVSRERMKGCVYMVWGWRPRINSESEYRNGTLIKCGSVYVQPVFTDWKWIFASKGDNSTISN